MTVIEFIGSPAAGKSSLTKGVVNHCKLSGIDYAVLPGELDFFSDVMPRLTLLDHIKSWLLVIDMIAHGLMNRRASSFAFREWVAWLRRLRLEWRNCAAYSRTAAHLQLDNRLLICDSAIAGGFLMEVADPRNPMGTKLLPKAMAWARRLPELQLDAVIFISTPPRIAMERESERTTNRVRLFLTHEQRVQFFDNAHRLTSKIKKAYELNGIPALLIASDRGSEESCTQTIVDFLNLPSDHLSKGGSV